MLSTRVLCRQPSSRDPFRTPCWDDQHPELLRIDATLPADHHARWLRSVVNRLDLKPLRLSYANRGSQAYLPEPLLAFDLFVYSLGILSPAQWVELAQYDDRAKWLLRGLCPSRSQLYTFRDRLEPFLDAWHKQLIDWAVAEGITTATRGSLDGTFVASLASRHQLMSCGGIDRRLLLLQLLVGLENDSDKIDLPTRLYQFREAVRLVCLVWLTLLSGGLEVTRLLEILVVLLVLLGLVSPEGPGPWTPRLPSWLPQSVAGRKRVLKRYEDAKQRITQRLKPHQNKKNPSKKDLHALKHAKVSVTDPEAALGWDKVGTFRPLYNLLLVQATDSPLTLSWDLQATNTDQGMLVPMMEKTEEQLGHHLKEVLNDGAFVSVSGTVWCENKGIVIYAPPGKVETAKAEVAKTQPGKATAEPTEQAQTNTPSSPVETAKGKVDKAPKQKGTTEPKEQPPAKKQEKFPKGAFRYDSEEEVYHCPEGKRLPVLFRTTEKHPRGMELPVIVHRASGDDCRRCPLQKQCTSNPKNGRVVKRYEGEDALERLEERMALPSSQEVYKQRCKTVELGFADLKEHRGLRVFRCFGKKRARTQAGLVILASNGLKITQSLRRRERGKLPPDPRENQAA